MAGYLVNKNHKDKSVVQIKELDGYKFRPHTKKSNYIKVDEVTIINNMMIDKILTMKFEKAFKRVVAMALNVLNDEDETANEGDVQIVLDEAQLVREILLNRYQKFLTHEKEELFLKKLRVIENEMRMKQVLIKQKAMFLQMQENKFMSRGR